jgi:hypothetical protein
MKNNGSSEHHPNNNLKLLIAFGILKVKINLFMTPRKKNKF